MNPNILKLCGERGIGLSRRKIGKKVSLKMQLLLAVILSAVIAFMVFRLTEKFGQLMVSEYIEKTFYVQKNEKRYMDAFRKYVEKNKIMASDEEEINHWIEKQKKAPFLGFYITRNGEEQYSTVYWIRDEELGETYHQKIAFSDGKADVYLYGLFGNQLYEGAIVVEMGFSVIIFVSCFLWFVQRKINYIKKLESEIKILETGGLEKKITVTGNDEIASLAGGLEQMRLALLDNMQKEEEAVNANYSLVIGIAHDLRTPLTSLLLYLDMLDQGRYKEEQLPEYLKKSRMKAMQIKHMSDQLFERFLLSKETAVVYEPAQNASYVLEDMLSDFTEYLIESEFEVDCEVQWPEGNLVVVADYIGRIFDNLSSNIKKYANRQMPVNLSVTERKGYLVVRIANAVAQFEEKMESTEVGISNVKLMMEKMKGECVVTEDSREFKVELWFPMV